MAGYTGSWTDAIGGQVADAYSWRDSVNIDGWFGDALGAWVTVEGMKAKTEATGAAQEATRSSTNYPSGSTAPTSGGSNGGGMAMNGQTLLILGLVGVAAVMVLK